MTATVPPRAATCKHKHYVVLHHTHLSPSSRVTSNDSGRLAEARVVIVSLAFVPGVFSMGSSASSTEPCVATTNGGTSVGRRDGGVAADAADADAAGLEADAGAAGGAWALGALVAAADGVAALAALPDSAAGA